MLITNTLQLTHILFFVTCSINPKFAAMKKLLFLFIIPALLLSCDKLDDANTIDFDTSIAMNMQVAVADANSLQLKSVADYPFSESAYASLYDDPDLYDYLDKIKSIDVENVVVTFYGIEPGMEIASITLSVEGVGELSTLNNITSSNTTHTPSISSSVLTKVANKLVDEWEIIATVAGTTTTAPMWFNVYVTYDLHVEAEAL